MLFILSAVLLTNNFSIWEQCIVCPIVSGTTTSCNGGVCTYNITNIGNTAYNTGVSGGGKNIVPDC